MRSALALLLATLAAAVSAGPVLAHSGGKAQPRIAAAATGPGLVRVLTVRVTDVDGGAPIGGARVEAVAEMTGAHTMRLAPWILREDRPGLYRARVTFPMPASWRLSLRVSGSSTLVGGTSVLPLDVRRSATAAPAAAAVPALTSLPTRTEADLGRRDFLAMASLWLHATSAMTWIVGVLIMVLALSTRPGALAVRFRERLAAGYRRWGIWAHWSLVPVITATGVYQMIYVTPFPLAWRPDDVQRLAEIPYGALYEALLIFKLGLFAALLISATTMLRRTVAREPLDRVPAAVESDGFVRTLTRALGPSGVLYLATVPLILAAAMAVRYVHVLSHVGEVLRNA